ESVVGFQIGNFLREISFYRLFNTLVEKFCVCGGIEKSVVVAGIIEDPHVAGGRRFPLEQSKQRLRKGLQDSLVFRHLTVDSRAYGKHHTGRVVAGYCERVMDQPAMKTTIPVFIWENVYESKRQCRCNCYRVNTRGRDPLIVCHHSSEQIRQIFSPRANMNRDRVLCATV